MPITAAKGFRKARRVADPLPSVPELQRLHDDGVFLRRGQLSLISATPNAGKSMFAEWLAARMNVRTLYFSADQDEWTTMTRLAACLSGDTRAVVQDVLAQGSHKYADLMAGSHISFCFDSSPTLDDIGAEIDAYVETWDEWPELIVIDNLVNVQGAEDYEGAQFIMGELHWIARATGAHVQVLVHASENSTPNPLRPSRMKDIINKLSKLPELILTVAYDGSENIFYVAKVKSRESKADQLAKYPFSLGCNLDKCQFYAQPTPTYAYTNYWTEDDE